MHLGENDHIDLDLSEEFLSTVLNYVDDLCNIINIGDPNLERSMEVSQNLNKAVTIYREKLMEKAEPKDDPEEFKYEPDIYSDPEESESEWSVKKKPKPKKLVKKTGGTVTVKREGAKKNGRPMKDRMEI